MDTATGLNRLRTGIARLNGQRDAVQLREKYVRGDQKLPFAPRGVNTEYVELQKQSVANFLRIAVDAPVQRLGVDSLTSGLGKEVDDAVWLNAWQENELDSRQSLVYRSIMVHGRGVMSVFPNASDRERPIIRPESIERVWIEPDPEDPFTTAWSVKRFTIDGATPDNGLILPAGITRQKTVVVVYDDTTWMRFEKGGDTSAEMSNFLQSDGWTKTLDGVHNLGANPMVALDYMPDLDGRPWSPIDALMAQQDAINTIRFNTLLAMQFAAFRQRIVTGFDPRILDKNGNVVYKTNTDGTPMLDAAGNMVPMIQSPGSVGVDRLLAFPGEGSKVFDLQESNLGNYITVLDHFLTTFFATAQIPPQYLLSKMANLSGDALAAAESTLASLVKQLQLAAGEGIEKVLGRAHIAMGGRGRFSASAEINWGDREARSFSATADAITKLISVGFPHRPAFEMLPGATKQKVDGWMDAYQAEQDEKSLVALSLRPFNDSTELPAGGGQPAAIEAGTTSDAPAPAGGAGA
jgi:hypothetical protein